MNRSAMISLLACVLAASAASAEPAPAEARLECRRVAGPGRVLCEVEVEVSRGRLAWADVLVVQSPDFARPLRSRVGPLSAAGGTSRRVRLPIALAATRIGRGELGVIVRRVRCVERDRGTGELCTSARLALGATVEVGPEPGAR
jgi:hypothetical protein